MKWKPVETAPRDGSVIQAWHVVYKVPLSVRWKENGFPYKGERLHWEEATYVCSWPEAAFSHWQPSPPPPYIKEKE